MADSRSQSQQLWYFFLFWSSVTLIASGWMLGSYYQSSQWLLLAGTLITLVSGVLRRICYVRQCVANRWPWRLLAASGVGVVFCLMLLIQWLNPAYGVEFSRLDWQLIPKEHVGWLPSGFEGPSFGRNDGVVDVFPYRNSGSFLLLFSSLLFYGTGLSLGLVRRKEVQTWLLPQAINWVLLTVVILIHYISRADLTLWQFRDTLSFTGSPIMFYKNANSAHYLGATALALAWLGMQCPSFWAEVTRKRVLLLVSVTAVALITSATLRSRAGFGGICVLFLLLYCEGLNCYLRESLSWSLAQVRKTWIALSAATIAILVLLPPAVWQISQRGNSAGDFLFATGWRQWLRELGITMWADRPFYGWGSGAYLYLVPEYENTVPQIREAMYTSQPNLNRFYLFTADSYWTEFLLEYGLLGLILGTIALVLTLLRLLFRSASLPQSCRWLMVAAFVMFIHGFYDSTILWAAVPMILVSLVAVALALEAQSDRETLKLPAAAGTPWTA